MGGWRPASGRGPEAREDVVSFSRVHHPFLIRFFETSFWEGLTNSMASTQQGVQGDAVPLPEREGGKFGELPGIAPSPIRRFRQRKNTQT